MPPILFPCVGHSHGRSNKGIPALLFGFLPLPGVKLIISGVTMDSAGAVLPGCTVTLYRTVDDVVVDKLVSDANGVYSFIAAGGQAYYVNIYKVGAPDVAGTTVNTLVGTPA